MLGLTTMTPNSPFRSGPLGVPIGVLPLAL